MKKKSTPKKITVMLFSSTYNIVTVGKTYLLIFLITYYVLVYTCWSVWTSYNSKEINILVLYEKVRRNQNTYIRYFATLRLDNNIITNVWTQKLFNFIFKVEFSLFEI